MCAVRTEQCEMWRALDEVHVARHVLQRAAVAPHHQLLQLPEHPQQLALHLQRQVLAHCAAQVEVDHSMLSVIQQSLQILCNTCIDL